MEEKKNKKYDLERKRPIHFNIGMMVSIALALVAFNWKTTVEPVVVFEPEPFIDEVVYVPPQTIQPPPPPPPKAVEIVAVDDNTLIEEKDIPIFDSDILEDEPVDVYIPVEEPVKEEPETIFTIVEEMPAFPGGNQALMEHITRNIKYPSRAQRMGVDGRVFVKFVIDEGGNVSGIEVVKGIGAGCDEEAIRVLKTLPKFSPGKQRGMPVKVQMMLPIIFKLH